MKRLPTVLSTNSKSLPERGNSCVRVALDVPLPRLFDYVVVDCELSYDEKLLAVLDRADSILLVVTPHLGAVRNGHHDLSPAGQALRQSMAPLRIEPRERVIE